MRQYAETSTEWPTQDGNLSNNYRIKLYKEVRSLARLGPPERRRPELVMVEPAYSQVVAVSKD